MDWTQYFVNFMNSFPWGSIILGICGGIAVMSPVVLKVYKSYKEFIKERADEKKALADAEEVRISDKLEEKAFRKKIWEVIDGLPLITDQIEGLVETTKVLVETEESLKTTNEVFKSQIVGINDDITKMAKSIEEIKEKSDSNDIFITTELSAKTETLHEAIKENAESMRVISENFATQSATMQEALAQNNEAINTISQKVHEVADKVDIIVECDLDSFRNHLLTCYTKYVQDHIIITKDEIERLCMWYNKYKKEGGNGWAEKIYYEILQCPSEDGVPAEDVARKFRYLVEKIELEHGKS